MNGLLQKKLDEMNGEEALKLLDRMARIARDASVLQLPLDDKVRFQKLSRTYEDARRMVRLMHFEYEDAVKALDNHYLED
jgi:hypothetical protein